MKHKFLRMQIYCHYESKDGLDTDIDTSTVVIILPPHTERSSCHYAVAEQ
jgi:hypothetical protein